MAKYNTDEIENLSLPDEAKEALKNGGTWEYEPESAEVCTPFVNWCDDCETYHLTYYGFGIRVEGGKLFTTVHSCDSDGNWEFDDEAEFGSEQAAKLEEWYGYDASLEGWKRYFEHVAETGEDPIHEFMVDTATKRTRKWQVQFGTWIGQSKFGVLFIGARPSSRGPWLEGDKLSKDVQQFLNLQKSGIRFYSGDFKTLDEVKPHVKVQRSGSNTRLKFLCDIEQETPRSAAQIKRELKQRARKALKEREHLNK